MCSAQSSRSVSASRRSASTVHGVSPEASSTSPDARDVSSSHPKSSTMRPDAASRSLRGARCRGAAGLARPHRSPRATRAEKSTLRRRMSTRFRGARVRPRARSRGATRRRVARTARTRREHGRRAGEDAERPRESRPRESASVARVRPASRTAGCRRRQTPSGTPEGRRRRPRFRREQPRDDEHAAGSRAVHRVRPASPPALGQRC